jgi:TonB-dependent SusC/RagA subfamily outer membrane receptor
MKFKFLVTAFLLVFSFSVNAQKKTVISGKVTDADLRPLPGISIFVDGTNTGRTTNINGYYRIKVKPEARMISVPAPTGQLNEMPINQERELNFIIATDKNANTPVVKDGKQVNIGYGTVGEKKITESVNSFNSGNENFYYNSIYDMLATQPEVVVSGKKVYIRGTTSLDNTPPLLIVDGITVTDIDAVSPKIVKSIDILKGAAASIYGAQGAGGVILITLKK